MMKMIKKFLFLCLLIIISAPVQAQSVIRDTEIEEILSGWFTPIFEANNMDPSQVKIILVQDNSVNAFVAGGSNIFFFTGLIEITDDPGELIAVMAHELGHISGGHLIRGQEALEQASYESIIGTIIGLGTALATGDAGAAAAGGAAGNSIASRRFFATSRTFEASADQAALTSMKQAGMDPTGLKTFLEKLQGQELLPSNQQSEYVRTHPLTRSRVDTIDAALQKPDVPNAAFPAEWIEEHERVKAKLTGYINPGHVAWKYDDRDFSIAANYARAIAEYRQSNIEGALSKINALIQEEPKNPYFHELKGQMLVDFGRVEQAIPSYQRALGLKPSAAMIRIPLAHALLQQAGDDKQKLNKIIDHLKRAVQQEPRSTRAHRLLATAYGQSGKDSLAQLHLAEESLLQRRYKQARIQAQKALDSLPDSSSGGIRARDILALLDQIKR